MHRLIYIAHRSKFWILAYLIVFGFGIISCAVLFFAIILFTILPELIKDMLPFLPFNLAHLVALPLQLIVIAFCWLLFRKMKNYFFNYVDRDNSRSQKKQKSHDFATGTSTNLTSIDSLPTAENIQQLISEDGEIPDEAFQKKHNN